MSGPRAARSSGWLACLAAVAFPGVASAQLTFSNLLEGQAGYNPFNADQVKSKNATDYYDQFNAEYAFPTLRLGARFEANHSSSETQSFMGYEEFTQRYADWSDEHLRARLGNFYTILGRGLIHRSFELPGVVLDQPGRADHERFGPSRDVDGVLAEADAGRFSARLFSGRPKLGDQALGTPNGVLTGAQGVVDVLRDSKIGAAYVRFSNTGFASEYASGFVEADPLRLAGLEAVALPLYFEYAQANRSWGDWWKFSTGSRDTSALYASANLISGPFALAAEWKDYRAFRLGFNDPPSLVPEHSYYLLNRNTHFLIADQEKGFQLEGSYSVPAWGSLTLNQSRGDGDIGSLFRPKPVRFEEKYAEVRVAPKRYRDWEGTVFYQRGKDEFISIARRWTAGASTTARFLERFSTTLDFEMLGAHRVDFFGRPTDRFIDRYVSLTVARSQRGSIAAVWQRTNDPLDEALEDQQDLVVQPNTFFSMVLNARLSDQNEATLFVGERRPGLACTAGTCYVVEAFKGAELRLTTRF